MTEKTFHLLHPLHAKRDAYGFALRPQHLQRYREYAYIYKEEEEERSDKWKTFLEQQAESADLSSSENEDKEILHVEISDQIPGTASERVSEAKSADTCSSEKEDKERLHVAIGEQILGTASDCVPEAESADLCSPEKEDKETVHAEVNGQVIEAASEKDREEKSAELCSLEKEDEDKLQLEVCEQILVTSPEKVWEAESAGSCSSEKDDKETVQVEVGEQLLETTPERVVGGDDPGGRPAFNALSESSVEKAVQSTKDVKVDKVKKWVNIRPVLGAIEYMMSFRVRKAKSAEDAQHAPRDGQLPLVEQTRPSSGNCEDGIEEERDMDELSGNDVKSAAEEIRERASQETLFPWKEELECLVRGGVPKDLRGELWQAFVGVRTRRRQRYYQDLLAIDFNPDDGQMLDDASDASKKWKKQIEKDIPRTFPGHPALDEHGRDSLRRLLVAYARHNPSVGYCQAMNFFGGLLLLLMPEENAFWTLVGIIDDYFEGYFTEEMIESQVDQLVFEDLVRERFPKLANHLDYLGVQVAWISGPWFLSIFINMLPWESVLRVWDVILFEGNRVMLFRTALALMELYGPALVTTKDAGDAITLLQSLAGSTFDSSQLVFTACMGYLMITENRLRELRDKHRPSVLNVIEERTKKGRVWKDSKGLASKLYSFKHQPGTLDESKHIEGSENMPAEGHRSNSVSHSTNLDDFLAAVGVDGEVDSVPDLQEQVIWLKVELCRLLEDKRSAILRAEELETALMEMVKQDNRLQLSARIEQLEQEVAELREALADKKEQEAAMVQVLVRVEQEHKLTEDARVIAEQDSAAQKQAFHVLQEKYETAMASLAQMEKRVVMAETMLEATLQYESGQSKALSSPRAARNQGSTVETPPKRSLLSRPFGLGWRDRNKGKPANAIESSTEGSPPSPSTKEAGGQEQHEQ